MSVPDYVARTEAPPGLRGRVGRQLGPDILEDILSRLSAKQLAAAELTCRHWQAIVKQRKLWKPHCTAAQVSDVLAERFLKARPLIAMPKPADLAAPPDADCCWRHEFLQSAAARRWIGPGRYAYLQKEPLPGPGSTAHMASHAGMLACADARDVVLYDVGGKSVRRRLRHDAEVGAIASAAPHLLLAASGSQVVLWRNKARVRAFTGAASAVRCVGAAGGTVASATLRDSAAQLHDLYSGALNAIVRPHGSGSRITAMHLAAGTESGSGMLASAAFNAEHNGELALTDTATGLAAALLQCPTADHEPIYMVHHMPDLHRVLCGWRFGGAAAFDLRKPGTPLWRNTYGCDHRVLYVPPGAPSVYLGLSISPEDLLEVRDSATGNALAVRSEKIDFGPDPCWPKLGRSAQCGPLVKCAAAVGGHLAVSTDDGVTLWRQPGYDTLMDPAKWA